MPRTTCCWWLPPGARPAGNRNGSGHARRHAARLLRQADLHFQNMEALSAGFASAEGPKGAADAVELGERT